MEKDNRPYLPWRLVDDFMTAVLSKQGVPEEEARLCADVLLESELANDYSIEDAEEGDEGDDFEPDDSLFGDDDSSDSDMDDLL